MTKWLLIYTRWYDDGTKADPIIVSRHGSYNDAWAALERQNLRPPYQFGPLSVLPEDDVATDGISG